MELAGHVPGGAIKTKRLKEISVKESRNEGLHSPPCRGAAVEGGEGLAGFGDWLLARSHILLFLLVVRVNQSVEMG